MDICTDAFCNVLNCIQHGWAGRAERPIRVGHAKPGKSAVTLITLLEEMDNTIDSQEMSAYDEELAVRWRNDIAKFYMEHYYDGAPDALDDGSMPVFSERI